MVLLQQDLEAKVAEKVEELWQKGRLMLTQVQQKQQEKFDKLAAEVATCVEKQGAIEAENEQLRHMLVSLAGRLSVLGAAFNGAAVGCTVGSPTNATTAASSVSASPEIARGGSSSELFTPVHAAAARAAEGMHPLPEVPAFPFPPLVVPQVPGAPLCLAEALGPSSQAPLTSSPTPLSLANSLPPTSSSGVPPQPQPQQQQQPPEVFSFALRKADATELGLKVSHHDQDKALLVEGVQPDGAVDAWNRQCIGSTYPERAVVPGDKIISVNNVANDPEKMLKECEDKQLLRLTIQRDPLMMPVGSILPPPMAAAAAATPSNKLTSLRAEASEFVPMAASMSAQAPGPEDTFAPGA